MDNFAVHLNVGGMVSTVVYALIGLGPVRPGSAVDGQDRPVFHTQGNRGRSKHLSGYHHGIRIHCPCDHYSGSHAVKRRRFA